MKFEMGIAKYVMEQMREGVTVTGICRECQEDGALPNVTTTDIYSWLRDADAKMEDGVLFYKAYREAEADRCMKWEDLSMMELANLRKGSSNADIAVAKARSALYRQGARDAAPEVISLPKGGVEGNDEGLTVVIRKFYIDGVEP